MNGSKSEGWLAVLFFVLAIACMAGYASISLRDSPASVEEAKARVTESWIGMALLGGGTVFLALGAGKLKRIRDERTRRRLEGA